MVLEHVVTRRRIVIDTKFTSILTPGRYRERTLDSGYLYQMYAYLRSQVGPGDPSYSLVQHQRNRPWFPRNGILIAILGIVANCSTNNI